MQRVRAPHSNLAERSDVPDRFQMAACLHAGSDNAEHASVRPRQMFHRHGGHGGSTGFGDVPTVHHGHQRARGMVEQQDGSQVRRQVALVVLRVHGHELGAYGRRIVERGGHHAEIGFVRPDFQHGTDRLIDRAA
jgi:hypothetical protein